MKSSFNLLRSAWASSVSMMTSRILFFGAKIISSISGSSCCICLASRTKLNQVAEITRFKRRKIIWALLVFTCWGIRNVSTRETSGTVWSWRSQLLSGPVSTKNFRTWPRETSGCKVWSIRLTFYKWDRKMSIIFGSWNWGNRKYQPGTSSRTDTKYVAFK